MKRTISFIFLLWTMLSVAYLLAGCSKKGIPQAKVMTQAEIDAYNHTVPQNPDDPTPEPQPDPEPVDPDPVNPDDPAPSDDRITDGTVYFVRPTALGLKDGSSWNNALDATGLCDLIAQKLNGEGVQDTPAAHAQADALDGAKFYFCTGKYIFPGHQTKLEWTGYAKQVRLEFYGGYAGTSSGTDRSQRNVSSNVSMLSGDINGNGLADANDIPILLLGNQVDLYMDGMTVAYCYCQGNGGAITQAAGGSGDNTITLKDCLFRDNMVNVETYSGGAISVNKGKLVASNTRFSNNQARNGGALYFNDKSRVELTNCTFSYNTANNCGGILNQGGGEATFTNCTFSNNVGGGYGGVLHVNGGGASMTCKGCTFSFNEGKQQGGVVSMEEGTVTMNNCTLTSNKAATSKVGSADNGGMVALLKANGVANLNNCTFKNNESKGVGGGVFLLHGRLYIDNCKFDSNVANNRGCLCLKNGSTCYMNRTTITGTTVTGEWGVAIQLTGLGALCANNCTIGCNTNGTKSSATVNGGGNTLFVNCTVADKIQLGILRAENGFTYKLLNSVLMSTDAAKPSILINGEAYVTSLGNCVFGSSSGTYTPGSGDVNNMTFGALDMAWDSVNGLYKWNGRVDGHTNIDASTIGDKVKSQFPISVTGKYTVKVDGQEQERTAFTVDNAGQDFYDWVTGISSTAFTTDAIGTSRGSSATCGAYQAN